MCRFVPLSHLINSAIYEKTKYSSTTLALWVLIRHAGPPATQAHVLCCERKSAPVIFLLSVKADHRPAGNNQVAAIFAVMLGGHDALEELSAANDSARLWPLLRGGSFDGGGSFFSAGVALFLPPSCAPFP